jgi:hypothetical protein
MTTATKANRIENVVIFSAERLNNSVNGNPRYQFHTDAGTFVMSSDASLGYGVDNYRWSEHRARYSDMAADMVIGNPAEPKVTLLTTRAGRVFGIERDGKVMH